MLPIGVLTAPEERRDKRAFLLPLAAVAMNVWFLVAERLPVQNVNDSDVHLQMIRWAEGRISAGHSPFDGWFAAFGLGSSHFHHYQSLPHIISGALAIPFNAQAVFSWSLFVLVAFWPLCMYWTGRLLDRSKTEAAMIAVVAPVVAAVTSLGYEHGAYIWRGYGVWSQMWAMWTLPLALGLTWQAMRHRKHVVWAAVAIGVTCCFHLTTAYLAFIWVGVLFVVKPTEWRSRLRIGASILIAGALVASWLLLPLLTDLKWTSASEFARGSVESEGYGLGKVIGWLVDGELFAPGAAPVLTALLAVGVLVAIFRFRRDEWSRATLVALAIGILLFAGRSTIGFLIRFIPGLGDAPLERFVLAVHVSGILLAGVGLHRVLSIVWKVVRRVPLPVTAQRVAIAAIGAAILFTPYLQRYRFDKHGALLISLQRTADATDGRDLLGLIDEVKRRGDGRVYAGLRGNWGIENKITYAPVYNYLANHGADAIGFTLRTGSLSSSIEARFNENEPAHYDLMNVRYALLPQGREPTVPARLVTAAGANRLYEIATSGYLEVVDTTDPITADRTNIGPQMDAFLSGDGPKTDLYPTVAFAGRPAAPPTLPSGARRPSGSAGVVESQAFNPIDGKFGGVVEANRQAVVLVKASFDPRWKATVDGESVTPQMLAPSFVGIPVGPGQHTVQLAYNPYPFTLPLLVLGALALIAIGWRRSPLAIRRK